VGAFGRDALAQRCTVSAAARARSVCVLVGRRARGLFARRVHDRVIAVSELARETAFDCAVAVARASIIVNKTARFEISSLFRREMAFSVYLIVIAAGRVGPGERGLTGQ